MPPLMIYIFALTFILFGSAGMATAQEVKVNTSVVSTTPPPAVTKQHTPIKASPVQEKCISIMSGFPNDNHEARYQFFKLNQELAIDMTPTLRAGLDFFGDSKVTVKTPVQDVIENIANPVFRQAAPEITIGNMGYLIDFALDCGTYLSGQINSLEAYDANLKKADFNIVIAEDALFMRQILLDTLIRVGGKKHEIFGSHVKTYSDNLVRTRDKIEYAGFENELASIETIYLTDLDGRLARSNDVINNEMNKETLASSLEITDDLNKESEQKAKRTMLRTLINILGGR